LRSRAQALHGHRIARWFHEINKKILKNPDKFLTGVQRTQNQLIQQSIRF